MSSKGPNPARSAAAEKQEPMGSHCPHCGSTKIACDCKQTAASGSGGATPGGEHRRCHDEGAGAGTPAPRSRFPKGSTLEQIDAETWLLRTPGPSSEELHGKVTHTYPWIEVSDG